jgi:hypothetical protein
MGTRSSIGVHVNGKDKLTYNQYDGYPTGMGVTVYEQVCNLIREIGWDAITILATNLKQVKCDKEFTEQEKEKYGDLWQQVDTGKNYYALLRGLQGHLDEMLKRGRMTKDNNFIKDSLFCEWAYILNVDEKTFEIYQGFQQEKPKAGRYKNCRKQRGYYACNLIHTLDLSHINTVDVFVLAEDFWSNLEKEPEDELVTE